MNTTTFSRPVRILAVALLSLGLSACTGDETSTHGTDKGPGAGGGTATASAEGYPGLYYDASVVSAVPVATDELRLVGAMTCAEMGAMVSAGQWRVADRLTLAPGSSGAAIAGIVPGVLLERAGTLAFVTLKGDRGLCTGTVTKARSDGIAITGKGLPGATTGWSATTMCVKLGEDTLNVSLYFDTAAKVGGLATITLVAKGGKYTVDGESADFLVQLLTHKTTALDTYSKAFGGAKELPGVTLRELEPGDAFSATATVDAAAADRPSGSFSLTGLIDSATDAKVDLSLPFSCAKVQVIKAG